MTVSAARDRGQPRLPANPAATGPKRRTPPRSLGGVVREPVSRARLQRARKLRSRRVQVGFRGNLANRRGHRRRSAGTGEQRAAHPPQGCPRSRGRSSAVIWSGLRPLGMDGSETEVVSRVLYAVVSGVARVVLPTSPQGAAWDGRAPRIHVQSSSCLLGQSASGPPRRSCRRFRLHAGRSALCSARAG